MKTRFLEAALAAGAAAVIGQPVRADPLHLTCLMGTASDAIKLTLDERAKTVVIKQSFMEFDARAVIFSPKRVTFERITNLGPNPSIGNADLMVTDAYELDRASLALQMKESSSITKITADPPTVTAGKCSPAK